MKTGKMRRAVLASLLVSSMMFSACGSTPTEHEVTPTDMPQVTETPKSDETPSPTNVPSPADVPEVTGEPEKEPDTSGEDLTVQPEGNYIKLALNVYYNDSDSAYYENESGKPIYVTGEGQYTVSFDCAVDLSEKAKSLGVHSLTNLTAIYLLDMGVGEGAQSPMTACNIMYDAVVVDKTALTVTQTAPKSAFKSSGIFDTNDPINSWDGSMVAEVNATSNHVANFTTVNQPTTISVTFTLSDVVWKTEDSAQNTPDETTEGDTAGNTEEKKYTNTARFSDMDFASMDAITLTKYLGNGINLGNTMEAYAHKALGPRASVSSYETYWGEPVTTKEMVQGMKDAGFDTLRIPVAWTNMMDFENNNFTIDTGYLDRVEEIVNYALDAEMFVIINDHWDGGWWGMFSSKTDATVEKAWTMYTEIWTQVAERFKDYSEMLIFESANEELGNSLNSNTMCEDAGHLTVSQCYEMTTKINQKFVDIVRGSGSKNATRFLLIAGYNTDITMTCDSRYVMPKDTMDGKLLISVHYYTPWNYCGSEKDARWGMKKEYSEMNSLLKKMTKFTDAGYGVIIGEYAALPFSENGKTTLKQNTMEFTTNFLDNCDWYNYCPMLWSCNDYYRRYSCSMINEEIAELFSGRRYELEEQAGEDYLVEVKNRMETAAEAAPEVWTGTETYEPGTPVAWIMWNGGAGTYSVGDTFNAADCTAGITAHNTVIEGPGEYTVSLDFAGGNDGLTFAALGLANCETLYPGCIVNIKKILVDGEPIKMKAMGYTCSDDSRCTRVNLLNEWVTAVPQEARSVSGQLSMCSPVILDKTQMVDMKNITIVFDFIVK